MSISKNIMMSIMETVGRDIPPNVKKELYELVMKITHINFPRNKRFSERPVEVESEDGQYKFSITMNMILVLQGERQIPNIDKLAKEMEKYFASVYSSRGDYLNCQQFGEKRMEQKVINPKSLDKLPKITVPERVDKKILMLIVNKIRDVLNSRKATVEGTINTSTDISFKIVKSFGSFEKIVKYKDDLYFHDGFNFYQIKNAEDGNELRNINNIYNKIMRALEVSSWKEHDFETFMSSPTGGE